MGLVRLALKQPYTVGVLALFLLLMGGLATASMPVDIFPKIDIPVVAVVWVYPGLSPEEMEKRVVLLSERGLSSTVDGIRKIESSSTAGIGLLKIYFQDGTNIGNAIAQITSSSQTSMRAMPAGMTPPYIIQSNASNVPVAQLTLSSRTMSEEKIADYGQNFIRLRLFTVPGLSTPSPYGGKTREITIDADPAQLAAHKLSAQDLVRAVQSANVILPAGTARIGNREYTVAMNASPPSVAQFASLPIQVVNGSPVTIGQVARVSDGYADQTNIVRVDGRRAAYLSILKKASASTLTVVEATKDLIPAIKAVAPEGLDVRLDFDQSTFVRSAIENVVHEAIISAILVALMILLFLGSWRSVVIAIASIPLALCASIIVLKLTGNTFNIMTLGGISLSIGLLVDAGTIDVENVHRNRSLGKPLTVAILDGAEQVSLPALMATLAICVVFFPVTLLTGPARFLFIPMALSVIAAMLMAYLLSRTLVSTLCRMLLAGETHGGTDPLSRFSRWFDRHFERFREGYGRLVRVVVLQRRLTLPVAGLLMLVTLFLLPVVGQDFFPGTDAGIMKLHLRAPVGTRIEVTEQLVAQAEQRIRGIVPAKDLQTINAMIGIPAPLNMAFVPTENVNGMDAEITVALNKGHAPTIDYVQRIRADLATHLPDCAVYFQTADIVSQVLNFGLAAPIDVQIEYPDLEKSYAIARQLRDGMRRVPGAADVNIRQVLDYPTLRFDVDRLRAMQVGVTERDVANNVLVSLSSSALVAPSYFVNPVNNVNYLVAVKVPMAKLNSVSSLLSTPVTAGGTNPLVEEGSKPTDAPGAPTASLSNLAALRSVVTASQVSHETVQRVLNITANVEGRDLGGVVSGVERAVRDLGPLPAGMHITVRGQGDVMRTAFSRLALGLVIAILLVYFLMVIMFQSWLDPFIIMVAVPGAFVGILWMLTLTGTTINVVSLMGSIMAVGIAVSNSILLVSFANDYRVESGASSVEAAVEAGKVRLRPVLMTAVAMVLGMIPMAIGASEGSEQNAPLGRAVIGGLLVATVVTLFVVPAVYAALRSGMPTKHLLAETFEREARGEIDPAAPHGDHA